MTTEENTKQRLSPFEKGLLWIIVGYVVVCAATFLVSVSVADKRVTVQVSDVATAAFQLESGKSYDFRYGKRTANLQGHAEAQNGLFWSSAVIDLQTTSTLAVDYRYGNTAYILEIPTDKITFHPDDSRPSSVVFDLQHWKFKDARGDGLDQYLDNPHSFHWVGVPYVTSTVTPLEENDWLQDVKPQWIMDKYLKRVSITLSSDDYSKILSG